MVHHWIIYMYTFPDGRRYVGATKRLLHLRQGSKESGWSRYKNCKALWCAIQEFGVDNIIQEILFEGDVEDNAAAYLETHFILLYKTNNPLHGFNKGCGGEGTAQRHISEERKIILAGQMRKLGKNHTGTHPSLETRKRQSLAKIGQKRGPMPEELRRRIGEGIHRANTNPESRKRRSDSKKQAVVATNVLDGCKTVFESGEEAAAFFGVRPSAITRWIDGSRKPSNGYTFAKFVEGGTYDI